jgi:superfamily II DNA helicase RecQ
MSVTVRVAATATDKVAHDVLSVLSIRDARKFRASVNRPNLFFQVTACRSMALLTYTMTGVAENERCRQRYGSTYQIRLCAAVWHRVMMSLATVHARADTRHAQVLSFEARD